MPQAAETTLGTSGAAAASTTKTPPAGLTGKALYDWYIANGYSKPDAESKSGYKPGAVVSPAVTANANKTVSKEPVYKDGVLVGYDIYETQSAGGSMVTRKTGFEPVAAPVEPTKANTVGGMTEGAKSDADTKRDQARADATTKDLRGFVKWLGSGGNAAKNAGLPWGYTPAQEDSMSPAEAQKILDGNPILAKQYFGQDTATVGTEASNVGGGTGGNIYIPKTAAAGPATTGTVTDDTRSISTNVGPTDVKKPDPPVPEQVKKEAEVVAKTEPDFWAKLGEIGATIGRTALEVFQAFAMGQAGISDPNKLAYYQRLQREEADKQRAQQMAEQQKAMEFQGTESEKARTFQQQQLENEQAFTLQLAAVTEQYRKEAQAADAIQNDKERQNRKDIAWINYTTQIESIKQQGIANGVPNATTLAQDAAATAAGE